MKPFELSKAGKAVLRSASPEVIRASLESFPAKQRRTKWLRKNNPYRVNCAQRYADQVKSVQNTSSVEHTKLIEYIAASGPAHAIDGWGFLARAMQALLAQDSYAAVHFAYYAELRAAMGLLACEGIGIFGDRHAVVSGSGQTDCLPKCKNKSGKQWARTHMIVVPALRHWSTRRRAIDLINQIVRPAGHSLTDWLDACGAHARGRAVATRWLQAWGMDLARIETDHDARNWVSYRPSEFRPAEVPSIDSLVTFVRELWVLFRPAANLSFPNLEANLLRIALRKCGKHAPQASEIAMLGFNEATTELWVNELL